MARKGKIKAGKLNANDIRSLLNKKSGTQVAWNLNEENPSDVVDWIPTGSRWLDSIICRGKLAGIPVGRITEIAGLEASGKSFMALQIAANAQAKGIQVVYFDSESSLDSKFMKRAGCDVDALIYTQAKSVEMVLESIELLLGENEGNKMLFIWDSVAMTPTVSDVEGDFNPNSSMAVKARTLSKGFQKLTTELANTDSTLLMLNQLKQFIPSNPFERAQAMINPYTTPGGKAPMYACSLRVWLTARKAKKAYIEDDKGYRIGSEVKVKLQKSRFGTEGRECAFKIMWADEVRIQDEQSWFEAIKPSNSIKQSGAWFSLVYEDGTEEKFQTAHWLEKVKEEKFKNRVLEIMDEQIILKFDLRKEEADSFYSVDED